MIVQIFVIMLIIAFILTILAVETDGIVYCGIGLIVWIVILVQSLWIVVDTTGNIYHEFGLSALSLAFIFVHIYWLFINMTQEVVPGTRFIDELKRR